MKKKFAVFAFILYMFIFLTGCASKSVKGDMDAVIFKIGKADACLFITDFHTVLIDTGEKDDGQEILDFLKAQNLNTIDYLIITHFDKDHIGGAPKVLHGVHVQKIIEPQYEEKSSAFSQYASAAGKLGIERITPVSAMAFTLDNTTFTVYPPQKDTYQDANDFSLITDITMGEHKLLFAGDALNERLEEFLKDPGISSRYTLLKYPHHGSFEKITPEFLHAANPKYTIITCSDKNPPDKKTIASLNKLGSQTYETRNGDVHINVSSRDVVITQQS